jgi:hypothetical protein
MRWRRVKDESLSDSIGEAANGKADIRGRENSATSGRSIDSEIWRCSIEQSENGTLQGIPVRVRWLRRFCIGALGFLALGADVESKDSEMFKHESSYTTVHALLAPDAKAPLSADDFDTELWLLLTHRIHSPNDLKKLPDAVGIYFASRYVQWEVGNGGFAQAAENIPEWFESAAAGYLALGKPKSAALIRKAIPVLGSGDDEALEALDSEIPPDEWEIDGERVEFVRSHRQEFEGVR